MQTELHTGAVAELRSGVHALGVEKLDCLPLSCVRADKGCVRREQLAVETLKTRQEPGVIPLVICGFDEDGTPPLERVATHA